MAQVFPTIENIKALKVQPTPGEWFLINYLVDNLPQHIEILTCPQYVVIRSESIPASSLHIF